MTRTELMQLPCWSCWWREGGACFERGVFDAQVTRGQQTPDDSASPYNPSCAITADLPRVRTAGATQTCAGYTDKRQTLGALFAYGTQLIITSEAATKEPTP